MNTETKPVESLQPIDFGIYPVWQYVNSDAAGETSVRPVARLPVASLNGKLVGVQVLLANGTATWALIGNVDTKNPRMTEHFITILLHKNCQWFALARYHDFDTDTRGPSALAKFLGLEVDEVFPISYDLSRFVKGGPKALRGSILKEPRERLSRSEIIALAVP